MRLRLVEPGRVAVDELAIELPALDQMLQCAVEECRVAALRHLEEVVHHLRAEQRALRRGGDPVVVEPFLAIRVHHHDARAGLLREVDVFHADRLIAGQIAADDDQQIGADPIGVGDGRRAPPDSAREAGCARRVADAGARADMVRADEASHFLMGIVSLVRDAAGRQKPSEAVGIGDT